MRLWNVALAVGAAGAAVVAVVFGLPHCWVLLRSRSRLHSAHDVPPTKHALVLGAGVRRDGQPSPILRGRLETAHEVWHAGAVRQLVVSGSPRSRGYSEPVVMRAYLLNRGVPSTAVRIDESGLDTWRSCRHVATHLGAPAVTVVTTRFHLRRAIALCRRAGLDARGVAHDAAAAGMHRASARGARRELFARTKAFWWPLLSRARRSRND